MIKVSKERFYAYVGSRDIVTETHATVQWFKTRDGKTVGKSNGYLQTDDVAEKYYYLTDAAMKESA